VRQLKVDSDRIFVLTQNQHLTQAHSKPKEAGLTRAMNPENVPVNFPETDKGIKIVR
jgi:hypothetical protein